LPPFRNFINMETTNECQNSFDYAGGRSIEGGHPECPL
jgi:hypothetical protein